MRISLIMTALVFAAGTAQAQEIVEVPASKSGVALPEDIFRLPPGQWYVARQVTQGNDPCTSEACEAGFHSGDMVLSVEHAGKFVQVIAGFRGCQSVGFPGVGNGKKTRGDTRAA